MRVKPAPTPSVEPTDEEAERDRQDRIRAELAG
jgi:hypothetical protein